MLAILLIHTIHYSFRSPRVEKRRVTIPIPAGIEDGQTLRMSVGGNSEIFITVRVEPSEYFRREGYDVHTDANISLSQALLGGIIRIQVIFGDMMPFKIFLCKS